MSPEQFTIDLMATALRHWPEGKAPVGELLVGICTALSLVIEEVPHGPEREKMLDRIDYTLTGLRRPQ
jgi:hypothetical protein